MAPSSSPAMTLLPAGADARAAACATKSPDGSRRAAEDAGDASPGGQSGARRRLLAHCRLLPRDRVLAVLQGLAMLEEAGLREVPSTRELHSAAAGALNADDATDYRYLCAWCRTPALWQAAVGPVDPSAHCRLWGKSSDEAAALRAQVAQEQQDAQQAALASESVSQSSGDAEAIARARRCAKRSKLYRSLREQGREGHFQRWWAAMLESDSQIRCLGVDGYHPQTLGEGPRALFCELETSWPLPPLSVRKKTPGAALPKSSRVAALSLGAQAQPRPRGGHARSFGHTVWFMAARGDVFGEGPPERRRRERPAGQPRSIGAGPRSAGRPPGPSAVVALHLGGAGCGVGAAAWRRLLGEHGLGPDGRPEGGGQGPRAAAAHFAESSTGRLVPRAVFADCDPAGLAGARAARCFAPVDLVEGPGGARGRWPELRGAERPLCAQVMEALRSQMERADSVQCLALTHSLSGFAGGGLAAGLMGQLAEDHAKIFRWNLALAPQPSGLGPSDCYNTLLSLYAVRSQSSLLTFVDNAALQLLAASKPFGLGIESPTFADHDILAAQVLTGFTSPMRIGPETNASEGWRDLLPWKAANNLVPYPRINCTFACCAPARPQELVQFHTDVESDPVLRCLTQGSLLSANSLPGKCLATGIWCRGLTQSLAVESVNKYKSSVCCQADYVPTGFVIGSQHDTPPLGPEVMALRNSTALLNQVGTSWGEAFDRHWQHLEGAESYFEHGMEAAEFSEAREDLASYANDGSELEKETAEEQGEEED